MVDSCVSLLWVLKQGMQELVKWRNFIKLPVNSHHHHSLTSRSHLLPTIAAVGNTVFDLSSFCLLLVWLEMGRCLASNLQLPIPLRPR